MTGVGSGGVGWSNSGSGDLVQGRGSIYDAGISGLRMWRPFSAAAAGIWRCDVVNVTANVNSGVLMGMEGVFG